MPHALDWIERNALASSVHFAKRKQFKSEIDVGQLVNLMIRFFLCLKTKHSPVLSQYVLEGCFPLCRNTD